MMELVHVNGEMLSVPGLVFRGYRWPDGRRFSIIAANERGAAELWSEQYGANAAAVVALIGESSWGGIELHSPHPWDGMSGPPIQDCHVLNGACWSDGSLLVYSREVLPLLAARDSRGILRLLADWHAAHFG